MGHRVSYNGSLGLNDYMKTLKQMEYFIFTTDGGDPRVTGMNTGTSQAWFDDDFWSKNQQIKA